MSTSPKRITPLPMLLSLDPDLLLPGPHQLGQSLSRILKSEETHTVDVVSYRTDLDTLEKLQVLRPRKRTRLLLVPPEGISHADVTALRRATIDGLEIRQVNRDVGEVVHLKLVVFTRADGKQYAVTGSANYTRAGTRDSPDANCEFSALFELRPPYGNKVRRLFDDIWDHGSQTLCVNDFASETSEDQPDSKLPTLLRFQQEVLDELKGEWEKTVRGGGALLSLPTGAGKTIIAVKFLFDYVLLGDNDYVLWLAPHEELLFQAASTFKRLRRYQRCESLIIPDESGIPPETQPEESNVTFRTTKKAHQAGPSKQAPRVVVIDEAHWGASESCEMLPDIRKYYQDAFFLGLTGTPFRREHSELWGLKRLYGNPVHRDQRKIKADSSAHGPKCASPQCLDRFSPKIS